MGKINKKLIFMLAIVILITTSLTVFAYDGHEHGIECDCEYAEYTYNDISEEKAIPIISFLSRETGISPMRWNLLCIFGHDKKYGTVLLTEHNYYPTQPKCKITYTDVEYCNRDNCDYFIVTDEYYGRIVCHP